MFPNFTSLPANYFDPVAIQHRTDAANAMTGALQRNDLPGYRTAAFDFLNWCDVTMHLPIQFFYVVLTPKNKDLCYLFSGGYTPDGTIVAGDGSVPDGCTNPLPGIRNITEPTGR